MNPCTSPAQNDIDQLIADSAWQNIHLGWMELSEIDPADKIIRIGEFESDKILLGLQHVHDSVYWLHTFCSTFPPSDLDLSEALKACFPPSHYKLYAISSHKWFDSLLEKNGFMKCDEILQFETDSISVPQPRTDFMIEPFAESMITDAFAFEDVFPPLWRLDASEFDKAFRTSDWNNVIRMDGKLIGYLLADRTEDDCHINRLVVRQEFQNSGAASALLGCLAGDCRKQNITRFGVNTNKNNTAAVDFYLHRNFIRRGRIYLVYCRYLQVKE